MPHRPEKRINRSHFHHQQQQKVKQTFPLARSSEREILSGLRKIYPKYYSILSTHTKKTWNTEEPLSERNSWASCNWYHWKTCNLEFLLVFFFSYLSLREGPITVAQTICFVLFFSNVGRICYTFKPANCLFITFYSYSMYNQSDSILSLSFCFTLTVYHCMIYLFVFCQFRYCLSNGCFCFPLLFVKDYVHSIWI